MASRLMTLQGQFVSQNQMQPQAMSMQAMSATQSPQNCQQQLDAIMQYLANDPAMADCLTAVQNINADPSYQNACDKLYAVNALNCSPADVIDVVITDPVYTPEEISELDCINAIYQLFYLSVYKSNSTYWLNADVKRCYSQIKGIIMKYFITPEPQRMDPCEFWEYLQQFLPCEPTPTIQEPVPTPTEPITYEPPVMTQPTPVHGFEPVQPSLNRVYYYHGDHLNSSTYVTDDIGRPVAYYDYLPFGEVAVEHNQTTNFNNGYKFNAKELDEATGMSYYGARYYDSRLSVFVSVDPLVDQTFEPYSYVGNNPVMFTDPTGMSKDEVIITGNMAKEAFLELQSAVAGQLILTMDFSGKLSYRPIEGVNISSDTQQLIDAIDDNSIIVNIIADDTYTTPNNELFIGGAFMGNTVINDNGKKNVVAEQLINPNVLKKLSADYNKPGADTLHEITEAYQGGLISKSKNISSPAGGKPNSVYTQAHNTATPQSGIVKEFIYDEKGNELKLTPSGRFPPNATNLEYKTSNGTIILKIP
ncbi:RHS repeat domain-containing protein [Capnocytophaga sp. ARDL2]|uniref:RHS repeat domain-containing protein n=1 Tax=Capnocytophaga sp. ARDL2 TaxID=3238809 RepID=UPI0035584A88